MWRKVQARLKLPIKLLIFIVAVPLVLILRLLRPLVIIRFGSLRSDRMGHFAGNTEMYLCERDAGIYGSGTFDVFYCASLICNRQLKKMWGHHLRILSPGIVFRLLDWANQKVPGAGIHTVHLPSDRDIHGYLTRFKPHLTFTSEEESVGRHYLKSMGLNDGDQFICFFARDEKYLDEMHPYRSRDDWSYHDFRCASIHNHVRAVEVLVEKMGYHAFRMGSVVKEQLKTNNPRIIDYATNGDRTEFLDIYLSANCDLLLQSGDSGPTALARVFRRPYVAVNAIPLEYTHGNPAALFIPKKLWSEEKRRFLTFKEILDSGVGRLLRSEEYQRLGLECIENTPEEIRATAIEAHERLRGVWRTSQEDEELQDRFQSLFPESDLYGSMRVRVGAEFLRQNRELLE